MTETAVTDDVVVTRWLEGHHKPQPMPGGGTRPPKDVFSPSSDGSGLSVCLYTTDEERMAIRSRHDRALWVMFTAGDLRDSGLEVVREPTPDEPLHGSVIGWPTESAARGRLQKQLTKVCRWDGAALAV